MKVCVVLALGVIVHSLLFYFQMYDLKKKKKAETEEGRSWTCCERDF